MIGLIWVACHGDPPPPPPVPDSGSTGETAEPPPSNLTALCGLQPLNRLRLECEVTLVEPSGLQITLDVDGEPQRVYTVDEVSDTHRLIFWDFLPETELDWHISAHGGTEWAAGGTTIGALPLGSAVEMVDVVSGESRADRLFFPWSCGGSGYLVITDAMGQVRWYEQFAAAFGVKGIEVSDEGTFLVISNRATLTEVAPYGDRLLVLDRADDTLDLPVHHDVASQFGQTVMLNAEALSYPDGITYIVDGVYEIDEAVVGEWSFSSIIDPQGLGEPLGGYWVGEFLGVDFGHANSIDVDDQGRWLISFKHLNTLVLVDRDGSVVWSLAGDGLPRLPNPLTLSSSAGLDVGFRYQHHGNWLEPGLITLFDNGEALAMDSRVITLEIDENARTADVVSSFDLGASCPIQSSGFLASDGSMIAACAANRHIYEFDADATLRREVSLSCPSDEPLISGTLVRVVPMSFDTIGRFARL